MAGAGDVTTAAGRCGDGAAEMDGPRRAAGECEVSICISLFPFYYMHILILTSSVSLPCFFGRERPTFCGGRRATRREEGDAPPAADT